jgi:hypothetical protein
MEFQLCPNTIQQLKELGFNINWTLLRIGYEGQQFLPRLISSDNILQYAECLLESMDSGYELIAQLIDSNDEMEFHNVLEKLALAERVIPSIQQRKLRVYVVHETLKTLPEDYCNGLFELTDLWISLGLPDDCPHTIQGRNNSYTPQEYYTQDTFDLLLAKNKKWVKEEINAIRALEN